MRNIFTYPLIAYRVIIVVMVILSQSASFPHLRSNTWISGHTYTLVKSVTFGFVTHRYALPNCDSRLVDTQKYFMRKYQDLAT